MVDIWFIVQTLIEYKKIIYTGYCVVVGFLSSLYQDIIKIFVLFIIHIDVKSSIFIFQNEKIRA